MTGWLDMVIEQIKEDIKKLFENDSGGHDYWHSVRVYQNAMKLVECEGGDQKVVALAAILHDVDDAKLFDTEHYENARNIMTKYNIDQGMQQSVIEVIRDVSYRGMESVTPDSAEGKIVQDADRLDAMGAIGIARTFAYGGSKGRVIYDPEIAPNLCMNGAQYIECQSTSVNHFFEKLFRLKGLMNTETARKIAEKREAYMQEYLDEFFQEWKGI